MLGWHLPAVLHRCPSTAGTPSRGHIPGGLPLWASTSLGALLGGPQPQQIHSAAFGVTVWGYRSSWGCRGGWRRCCRCTNIAQTDRWLRPAGRDPQGRSGGREGGAFWCSPICSGPEGAVRAGSAHTHPSPPPALRPHRYCI